MPQRSYRMLWDLRLISFQQRFMSPVWLEPPPLSLRHSVPSSCPSPSTVDWHGTQWHPGHEGRPAAAGGQNRTKVIRYCSKYNGLLSCPCFILSLFSSGVLSFFTVLALLPPLVIPIVSVSLTFPCFYLSVCVPICLRLSCSCILVFVSLVTDSSHLLDFAQAPVVFGFVLWALGLFACSVADTCCWTLPASAA